MDTQTLEHDRSPRPSSTEEIASQADAALENEPIDSPLDASSLVARMVEAGEWPAPEMMKEIVASGDAAVEPLIAILRSKPRGWPAEAPLSHAIDLLSALRPSAAVPELIEIIKSYPEDSGSEAAYALGDFGRAAFEPLLELCADPALHGYKLNHAISAARRVAGADPELRARLAELIRPMLAAAMTRVRQEKEEYAAALEADDSDDADANEEAWDEWDDIERGDYLEDNLEDDELGGAGSSGEESSADVVDADEKANKVDSYDEVMFFVSDLAGLADPLARDMIKAALVEDMVEKFFIDEEDVDILYSRGGTSEHTPRDPLDSYREAYDQHMRYLERKSQPPPPKVIRPLQLPDQVPPVPDALTVTKITPFRNVRPAVGRNDPCWCGSGKKYKKCHLGKDNPE